MSDKINHPAHYTYSKIETIEAIEAWNLPYHLGNAVKYISRAGHKGNAQEDIRKAIWYLQRYLEKHNEVPNDTLSRFHSMR